MNGTLERIALEQGGRVIRLERRLNRPIKDVWTAVTQPKKLAQWLAHADAPLSKVGGVKLRFDNTGAVVHCTVTKVKAPTLIEFAWEAQDVPKPLPPAARRYADGTCGQPLVNTRIRLELHSDHGGTNVVLSHTLWAQNHARPRGPGKVDPAVVLASWYHHLDGLSEALGRAFRGERRPKWGWSNWADLRDKYSEAVR